MSNMNTSVPCAYFSVYHKKSPVYANDWVFPIQTGFLQSHEDLGFLKDCDGINIAEKNRNYGELTAHYWVWKNFLPSFTGDYIGFGHYRRFLSLRNKWSERLKREFVTKSHAEFSHLFGEVYTLDTFRAFCGDADAIVPRRLRFRRRRLIPQSTYSQFVCWHPKRDLDACLSVIARRHPGYVPYCDKFFRGNSGWFWLNFILRKELFADWCEWIFDVLGALEKECDWSTYDTYDTIRIPAYLAERLFNVWLLKQKAEKGLKIKETPLYLLCDTEKA